MRGGRPSIQTTDGEGLCGLHGQRQSVVVGIRWRPSPRAYFDALGSGATRHSAKIAGRPAFWSLPDQLVVLGVSHVFTVAVVGDLPPSTRDREAASIARVLVTSEV